jgi:crotonobetainyl-CoA:carnitine CoA-transferase CaiB-like acyl-CoA transferase
MPDAPGPLQGWRVLELSEGTAASFCAKILSDLGAEVLMVEPPGGHRLRTAAPRRGDGLSGRFLYLAAGKGSVVIDSAGDRGRLRSLVDESDLIVTDLPPDRLMDLEGKRTVFVTPFGLTGPHAGHPAHHLTVFHASGESSTLPSGLVFELFPDRPPIQLGSDIGYFDAGWNAAVAALALMHDRTAQQADVSIQESLLTLSRTRLNRFNNEGICAGRERSRYGITGMMRCRDGWVQLVGMREEQWDRLIEREEGAEFKEAGFDTGEARSDDTAGLGKVLAAWCAARPKRDVARILAEAGAPVGIFADAADCLNSEQFAHRHFFQEVDDGAGGRITLPTGPYRLSRAPLRSGPAPRPGASSGFSPRVALPARGNRARLLEGVRVLDFTWAAAGPYATLLLGFLGAEVVKVESLRRLDPARRGFIDHYEGVDRSPIFNELNLNKRSLQVDLTTPEGLSVIKEILGEFDIVVENFRPGVMARLGLGPQALLRAHPRLIVASSSANGATGPEATAAGLASIFAASGGLSVQTGYRDGPPTEIADPMDYRSGAALTVAILAALLHRSRTGEGQTIDLSSREVAAASAPDALLAEALGVPWQPRLGNGHHTMAPHDVYPCAGDGWVAIAVGDEPEWAALCRVLNRPGWVEEFATSHPRQAAQPAIDEAIRQWTTARSAGEAARLLQAGGVPASPVMTFRALAEDPHLDAREVFVEVEHAELGPQRVMRAPWRFSESDCGVRRPGPLMGADNDEVVPPQGRLSPERKAEVFR